MRIEIGRQAFSEVIRNGTGVFHNGKNMINYTRRAGSSGSGVLPEAYASSGCTCSCSYPTCKRFTFDYYTYMNIQT